MFGLQMVKGYVALAIGILVIVGFIMLSGIGTELKMEYIVLNVLVILMIGATLLNTIIQIHIYEAIGGEDSMEFSDKDEE